MSTLDAGGVPMAKVVYYAGDVQGVGFRATASWIARRHTAVRGWVRNLPDGRVELLADGPDHAVAAFLAEVRERMADNIESEDIFVRDADDTPAGFHIVG
ncbi:MAG TPA: acylphosphatase [Gemmataceae bacterium]|nr:acylphosphatase [Gemmataceae bacterium]